MSWLFGTEPDDRRKCPAMVELAIAPRTVDIGNFEVHRALPFHTKRLVGPFIFWDQMGPGEFLQGQGVDVRPHPHIGLSTVTYLFDGSMDHKDSLGSDQRIVPGDVNLMTAGAGIVHSERTGRDIRTSQSSLFGIQSWLAQPKNLENSSPGFRHVASADIPSFEADGIVGCLILGEFQGYQSPVLTQWETFYAVLNLKKGARIDIPIQVEERALYLAGGRIKVAGMEYANRQMVVLRPGCEVIVEALDEVHMMLLGGAAMDGIRYIWWNFVSSSIDHIKNAADEWKSGKFATVPGDEKEFIPLPELPFPIK
ncbi:MAG: pirin family protein [Desulfobacterales bacterium]|nr:pirin family protein [Desulfobacterales bacterium]